MAIKKGKKWLCTICGKVYGAALEADGCRDSHDVVLVRFLREDLNRLIAFVYSKEESALTPSLLRTLKTAQMSSFTRQNEK